jgi:hypothetical protein
VGGIAVQDAAVGQDDLGGEQLIGGDPVAAAEDSQPAAEGQPGDPDRWAGPGGDGQVMLLEGVVDCAEPGAGADGGQAARDRHRGHRCHVDHQPTAGGASGNAVAAAAGRARQAVPPRERDRLGDVLGGRAPDNGLRPNVMEAGVERQGHRLEGRRAGQDHLAGDPALQGLPAGQRPCHGNRLLPPDIATPG